jgi:hypothetical protein
MEALDDSTMGGIDGGRVQGAVRGPGSWPGALVCWRAHVSKSPALAFDGPGFWAISSLMRCKLKGKSLLLIYKQPSLPPPRRYTLE